MAIDSTIVWEVQGGVGSDDNGGGYDLTTDGGTDYSQQAAAELTLTDLACVTASTTLTSATGGFTAVMVDNIIQIKSGTNFTVGFYQIRTYVDTNEVTIDRTACDGVGDATAGTGSVGGCLNTIDKAMDDAISGNTVYVKYATYTEDVGVVGGVNLYGYKTTRNDFPKGDDRPLIDGESTRTNCFSMPNISGCTLHNFRCTGATGIGVDGCHTVNIFNVKVYTCGSHAFYNQYQRAVTLNWCEANSNIGKGFSPNSNTYPGFYGCWIHDNDAGGVQGNNTTPINCIFSNNTGTGVYCSAGNGGAIGCTFYNNSSDGFNTNGSTSKLLNCTSSDNGGDGFDADGVYEICGYCQADGNGGDGFTAGITGAGRYDSDTIQTGDPKLNAPGTFDYTLQAGSSCLDNGCDVGTWTGATT